jgi:hypothetical protein
VESIQPTCYWYFSLILDNGGIQFARSALDSLWICSIVTRIITLDRTCWYSALMSTWCHNGHIYSDCIVALFAANLHYYCLVCLPSSAFLSLMYTDMHYRIMMTFNQYMNLFFFSVSPKWVFSDGWSLMCAIAHLLLLIELSMTSIDQLSSSGLLDGWNISIFPSPASAAVLYANWVWQHYQNVNPRDSSASSAV